MKTQFLIQQGQLAYNKFFLNCSILSEMVIAETTETCLKLFEEKLDTYLTTTCKKYINAVSGSSKAINCPEGFVLLPIDSWHCKEDKKPCLLQAAIDLKDKDNFCRVCRSDKKEAIFKTIEQKRYTGFHHTTGRYLCPVCDVLLDDSKNTYKYHYPWEIYSLSECADFNDQTIRMQMINLDIPLSISHSKVCATCFVAIIKKLKPIIADDFFVYETDLYS
jgi:hypothetical protein